MKSEFGQQSKNNNDRTNIETSVTIMQPNNNNNNNNNNNDEFSFNHYQQQEDILTKPAANPLVIYVVPPEECANKTNNYKLNNRASVKAKPRAGLHQQMNKCTTNGVKSQNGNGNCPDHDSKSLDTTSSDVNSNDDAESIVSRLSMIVIEQETQMNDNSHKQIEECYNNNNNKTNYNTHHDDNDNNDAFKEATCKEELDGKRPRSFTVNTVINDNMCKVSISPFVAPKDSNGTNNGHLINNNNNNNNNPYRNNINVCDNSKLNPCSDSNNPEDNMLTITRSTWTLSEFDRIFPKVTSKERKRSADLGSSLASGGQANNNFVNYEPNLTCSPAGRFHPMDAGLLTDTRQQQMMRKQSLAVHIERQLRNRSGTDISQETSIKSGNGSNGCLAGGAGDKYNGGCGIRKLTKYIPSIEWMISYEYKQWLLGDIMAGLVVASLNISLCLAAALLADVDASVAFRSSIVSTFIYAIFCTSRHTSFGAYSIMALMASVTVQRAMNDEMVMIRLEMGPSASMSKEEHDLWRYKIMIFYTFLTGLVQLVGGLLGLGTIVASFIPEALCSSLLASTAIAMAVGQLANMCGLNYKTLYELQTGDPSQLLGSTFKWCHQLLLLFENLHLINYVCLALSLSSMILLFANTYVFQQRLEKIFKRRILIPFELLILVLSTVVSYIWQLEQDYQVETSGPVLITFDLPTMPDLRLIQELWLDALVAGLISFTLTVTLAKLLAQKLNYELDSNQEMIACGLGNIMGGLFDALPASGTAIRSTTQVAVGGKTQLASIVNCVVLVMLAQTCGNLISPLPRCIMASILCYGFIRIISQTRDAFKYWRLCKVDFSIWFVGFVAILSFDLIHGFVVSFIYSILTILYRAQNRRAYLLGSIDSSDVYVPINKYPSARKIDGIEIYQYCGSLHYACSELFEQKLRQQTGITAKQIKRQLELMMNGSSNTATTIKKISQVPIDKHNQHKELNIPTHIILDFSMISFVDSSGVFTMKKIIEEYQSVNITVLFASLATHVAATVKNEPSLWDIYHSRFYVTLSDAVHNALRQRSSAFV